MIYLTYNDPPSGIYSSQVIDVCSFLNSKMNTKMRLVSLISLRNFWANKNIIKSEIPSAIILPMFPKLQNWKWNYLSLFILFIFLGRDSVIARGPFAASLALGLKKIKMVKFVCFDARGAYHAELSEYNVTESKTIINDIFSLEQNCVLKSDFRIAVSEKLVGYWKEKLGYDKMAHAVVPCTVNPEKFTQIINEEFNERQKLQLGFSKDDIIFVYSGSSAGWQSFHTLDDFLCNLLKQNQYYKVLFLIDKLPQNLKLLKMHPGKIKAKNVSKEEVGPILVCCDYGLLIREESITNQVASPVKFAEYLAAGLKVLISENIGDYSDFVINHQCGYVVNLLTEHKVFLKISPKERRGCINIANKYFLRSGYLNEYKKLLNSIS